jgi:hypothetical protein
MTVLQLITSCRDVLQDQDKTYWDDSELLNFYNECKRTMAQDRLEIKTTATLVLDPLKNDYDTDGILRYIRAEDDLGNFRTFYPNDESIGIDSNGIIIKDYNKIYVAENALKYYILSKAYEKETDMENFTKADYFYSKYMREFAKLMDSASANYKTATVMKTEANYF